MAWPWPAPATSGARLWRRRRPERHSWGRMIKFLQRNHPTRQRLGGASFRVDGPDRALARPGPARTRARENGVGDPGALPRARGRRARPAFGALWPATLAVGRLPRRGELDSGADASDGMSRVSLGGCGPTQSAGGAPSCSRSGDSFLGHQVHSTYVRGRGEPRREWIRMVPEPAGQREVRVSAWMDPGRERMTGRILFAGTACIALSSLVLAGQARAAASRSPAVRACTVGGEMHLLVMSPAAARRASRGSAWSCGSRPAPSCS